MLRKRTWIFLALALVLQTLISLVLLKLPNPADIIRIQTTFTLETFQNILNSWSRVDRSTFLLHYAFDFFYPWAYGFLFYFLLQEIPALAHFRYLALLAALSDELENILHFMLINGTIPLEPALIFAAGVFSAVKWLLMIFLSALVVKKLFSKPRPAGNINQ